MGALVFHPNIQTLTTILEEGARANARSTGRFIEPTEGTLRRATSRRHHIVFGRRGSGKSSLLFKSAETLSADGRPMAYVDLEPFQGSPLPRPFNQCASSGVYEVPKVVRRDSTEK